MTVAFPGGTALSQLGVYTSPAPADGVVGGTPHLHLVSTEAYIVTSGTGRLETITREGFVSTPLGPGSVVWFGAGTIHRAVSDGDLQLHVLMANAGLPEAGDAVITFPLEILQDAARYRALASLPSTDARDASAAEAAAQRRDLAVEGFLALRAAAEAGDPGPLERTYAAAIALVRERATSWRELWQDRVLSDVARTEELLVAVDRGHTALLGLEAPTVGAELSGERLGMCGLLRVYDLH